MKKKLLLLGGSKQQIPVIKRANKKGIYTILCDYLPDNPGQHYSNEFYCISTTDKQAILEVAKNCEVDGIIAYASDPAAPTAAYVAEKLGLPGQPYESVKILTNKDLFRDFLSKHHFCTPKAQGYESLADIKKDIQSYKLPLIIKPVDSSGSKGVTKLVDLDNLEKQVEYAMSFSRKKKVIIEEYVEMKGYQVAGDGFSINGQLKFRCFANDHFNRKANNPYVPISASFPYNNSSKIHNKIHNEIQRLLELLNMGTGAYNFDVRVDENDNIYLMEVGPRNGGNYIPQVIKYATGADLLDLSIDAAIGNDCSNISMNEVDGFWSYFAIHSLKAGKLKDIFIDETVRNSNIVKSYMNYKNGDYIPQFKGSNDTLGILIMRFNSMNEMLYMMDHSHEWIDVKVV